MEMPQSPAEDLGVNFCRRKGKTPRFYCQVSRIEDGMGVVATRASRHRGGPPPRRRDGGEEAARGTASVLFQVLFFPRRGADAEECNYTPPPIRDKDVTGEGAATQQPATSHVQGATRPRAPSKFQLINIFVEKERKSLTTAPPTGSGLETFSLCSPSF